MPRAAAKNNRPLFQENLFTPEQIRCEYLICSGVFSLSDEKQILPDTGFLVSAMAAWCMCALVTLSLTALLAATTGMGEQVLGYLSSANSFICAAAAGAAAISRSRLPRFFTALLTGTALVILLLTAGFLIRGEEMDPSSILSVVSFSYAGALTGCVFRLKPGKQRGRRPFHSKKLT